VAFSSTSVLWDDPPLPSLVSYSCVKDASPINLSDAYAILIKSLNMADQIGEKDVVIVIDYGIHGKAVDIISQKNDKPVNK
ncbi:hypothetical protein SK128_027008, partial [Halocaridina rubra]